MALQLCDIFDATEDILEEAMAQLRAQPVSAEQQEMLGAIKQEMAERENFSHMHHALSSLFSELEAEHDDVPQSPETVSHEGLVVPADDIDGQLSDGLCAPVCDPEQAHIQAHPPASDCASESPDHSPNRVEALVVDVAAAARLAFHAERRKAGNARKALRCSSTISANQNDRSPPPTTPAAKKPPVPSSFRLTPAATASLPANKPPPVSQIGNITSYTVAVTASDQSCCAGTSPEPLQKPGTIPSDACPRDKTVNEIRGMSAPPSACDTSSSAVGEECRGAASVGAQPPLSSGHGLETGTHTTTSIDEHTYLPGSLTSPPAALPRQECVQSVTSTVSTRDVASAPPWHVLPATATTAAAALVSDHMQSPSTSDQHAGEPPQATTCTSAHADAPLDTVAESYSAACDTVPDIGDPVSSDSNACDVPLQLAPEYPLVLEDSYRGSDTSENCREPANIQNQEQGRAEKADQYTHVALAKTDESKMAVPSWSAFHAVEALSVDGAAHSTGVSSWYAVPEATRFHLSGANSAPCWQHLGTECAQFATRPLSASSSTSCSSSKDRGYIQTDHADIKKKESHQSAVEHVYKRGFLKQSGYRSGRRSGAPVLIKAAHLEASCAHSCDKQPRSGHVPSGSVAGCFPAPDGMESNGYHGSRARGLPQDLQLSLDAVLGRSNDAACTSHVQDVPCKQESAVPRLSALTQGQTAPSSSHGSITQLAPVGNRASSQEGKQAQNCSNHTGGSCAIPAIGSVEDLSRGSIVMLSQVYPNMFPSFLAIFALYWKTPTNVLRPPDDHERNMRSEKSVVLLNDCLDTGLQRCDVWCDNNSKYGEASPDWADTTKVHNSRPGTSTTHASDSVHVKSMHGSAYALPPVQSGGESTVSSGTAGPGWHYRGQGRVRDPFSVVAVPGWVPQLTNGVARQRFFKIIAADHPEVEELVGGVLREMGWIEDSGQAASVSEACSSGCHLWNLCWTWTVRARVPESKLLTWQRINHFQECRNLTRKDLLTHHLQRHASMFRNSRHADAFQCLPTTFTLPKEFEEFEETFKKSATAPAAAIKGGGAPCARPEQKVGLNVWIMKPSNSSRGRGIYLLDDISAAVCSQPSVVQRYVTGPYLYQGYKFDLRLYVLVTSFNPLEAFIFKEGFARFALELYTNDATQRGNSFVHLTNSSIQVENLTSCQELPPFLAACKTHKAGATKMSLSRLWPLLQVEGLNTTQVWEDICSVTLAALYSAQDAIPSQATAFELYGVDVMLDQAGKVWLLEVNASPSLGTSTPLDKEVKRELIRDVINLVDPVPFDRVALQHVLRRRQQERTGPARRSRGHRGGLLSGTEAEEREVMNTDLHAILKGQHPRVVGVMPSKLGKFERIAPCLLLQQFQRMRKGN